MILKAFAHDLQGFVQLVLYGALGNSHFFCYLGVGISFKAAFAEDSAAFIRQGLHGFADELLQLPGVGVRLLLAELVGDLPYVGLLMADLSYLVVNEVFGDSDDVGFEGRACVYPVPVFPDADEGFLHDLIGFFPAGFEAGGESGKAGGVPFVEEAEGRGIAGAELLH